MLVTCSFNSAAYWESRYKAGHTSGDGSYGDLAVFKAQTVNQFVVAHKVQSVIEWGCGDGNQLTLAQYPAYLGLDVSPTAVALCRKMFARDPHKRFELSADYVGEIAELALSLDVIFHLTEDDVYAAYMVRLFASAARFVCIYASDTDEQQPGQRMHMRHHQFSRWVGDNVADWSLAGYCNNPLSGRSLSNFYIYEKLVNAQRNNERTDSGKIM